MSNESTIWIEKYRPQTFEEVKGQQKVVQRVKAFVEAKNVPHLLFSGPAGVGKTTLSLVIAKQLFGEDWRQNTLELNASDERGIDVVRTKVKDFARFRAIGNVPFKIIYLDECLDYNSIVTVKSNNNTIKDIKIGDFVKQPRATDYQVKTVDDCGDEVFTSIKGTIEKQHNTNQGFFSVKIHNNEIQVTGNHEFLTNTGWKRADELQPKDLVLCPMKTSSIVQYEPTPVIYNLVGLSQEIKKKERYIHKSPEKELLTFIHYNPGLSREELTKKTEISSSKLTMLLSEKKNAYYLSLKESGLVSKRNNKFYCNKPINYALDMLYKLKREQNNTNQEYIVTQLKDKSLFPIRADKAVICARLLGHLFSDGSLSLKTKQLFFSGKDADMNAIKKDLNTLGYYGLGNTRHSKWKNGECWSFGAYKLELLSLFYSLGVPVGKKTDTITKIPDWIMSGPNLLKKEFLAAFFGGDGYEPKFQGRTVKPIVIGISKRVDLEDNLLAYMKQIQQVLLDLGVDSKYRICPGVKSIRKDGSQTKEGRIWVTNSFNNILAFLQNVGYRYCAYKEKTAVEVIQYLSWKKSLGKAIYSFRPVPHFYEWRETLKLGDSAYHYVTAVEKIDGPEKVYCLSTQAGRFIANGIVVKNCDALTRDAQQALRRTMEQYASTTRFILSCNYVSKIIDPIQSRCTVFKFQPLSEEDIIDVINGIAQKEGLTISKEAKDAIYTISKGDCRRVENILQSSAVISKEITPELIYSLAAVAKPDEVKNVLELALKNDFLSARNVLLDTMLKYGLAGSDMIKQMQQAIWDLDLPDKTKVKLIDRCGDVEFRMTEGSDEFLQLESFLAFIALQG